MADIRENNDGLVSDRNARRTPPALAAEIAGNLAANARLAWGVRIFGRMNAQRFATKEQAQRLADQIGGEVCN